MEKAASTSRMMGAILMVAGTTIGAGMLALPITSVSIGFFNSVWLLVSLWFLMCFTALVTLEINLRLRKTSSEAGISMAGLADQSFGKGGRWIASVSLMILFYALLAAYITGGSSLIKAGLDSRVEGNISFPTVALCFTVFLGALINWHVQAVDYANRFFFTSKIVLFLLMVCFLAPFIRIQNLMHSYENVSAFAVAVPIFFSSFGFHGSIPALINYIGPHPRSLRLVLLIGSFIPLIVYLIWQTVTLGVLPLDVAQEAIATQDLAVFIHHLNQISQFPLLFLATSLFTFLAIVTSFLGVALGLFEAVAETLRWPIQTQIQRLKVSLLTFLPPLFFALFYHNGFIIALGYAAIGLSFLAVLMPVAIAFRERSRTTSAYQAAGGYLGLMVAFAVGILVIVFEIMNRF